MRDTHYSYSQSENEPRYLIEEGLVWQWIRVMGNCGKLLIVGIEWGFIYMKRWYDFLSHKLPREMFPHLRVYKNERIREEAVKVYENEERNSYIDYDSPELGADTYVHTKGMEHTKGMMHIRESS